MCGTFTGHPLTQQNKNETPATITRFLSQATGDRLLTA